MIYIFLKLIIKNLHFHYSILFYNTSKSTSFNLRKIENHSKPTSTFQPTKKSIILKNKFCKPKYIHKSFIKSSHVCKVYVPVTVICVVSSPFLFQPILVNQSYFSIYIYSLCYFWCHYTNCKCYYCTHLYICRNQWRAFFNNRQLCYGYVAQLIYVNCVYIVMMFNIALSTCIPVNCVEILLNVHSL